MAGVLAPFTLEAGAPLPARGSAPRLQCLGRRLETLNLLLGPSCDPPMGCIRIHMQPPVPVWLTCGQWAPPFGVAFGQPGGHLCMSSLSGNRGLGRQAASQGLRFSHLRGRVSVSFYNRLHFRTSPKPLLGKLWLLGLSPPCLGR